MTRVSFAELLQLPDLGGITLTDPDSDIREIAEDLHRGVMEGFDDFLTEFEGALRNSPPEEGFDPILAAELLKRAVWEVNLVGFNLNEEGDEDE